MLEYIILFSIICILSLYDLYITFRLAEHLGWQGEANPIVKSMGYNKFMMSIAKIVAIMVYGVGCYILLQSGLDWIVFRGIYFIMGIYLAIAVTNTLIYQKSGGI